MPNAALLRSSLAPCRCAAFLASLFVFASGAYAQTNATVEVRNSTASSELHGATKTLDLLALPSDRTPEGKPVWTRADVIRKPSSKPGQVSRRIVLPEIKGPGRFADAKFAGTEASWESYDRLELEVNSLGNSQMALVLYEWDGENRESYSLSIPMLKPGLQKLSFRLIAAPEGDLHPTSPGADYQWNPDALSGVQLLFADYPQGFSVESMRLIQTTVPGRSGGGVR